VRGFVVLFLVFTSCAGNEPLALHFNEAKSVVEAPKLPEIKEFSFAADKELEAAVRKFQATGRAPVIKAPGFMKYPFGETEPVIRCQPLRACSVELEVGEEIMSMALGDTVRWEVQAVSSGSRAGVRPQIIIKPRDFEIATNLIVSTSRRTYHLALLSDAEHYVRQFKFYYPGEMLKEFKAGVSSKRSKERRTLAGVSAENLNFNYRLSGRHYFRPTRVFDDGRKVYVEFSKEVERREAPVLLVQGEREAEIVNYRKKGKYYVVDKLFEEAVLVLGAGRGQKRVRIFRR